MSKLMFDLDKLRIWAEEAARFGERFGKQVFVNREKRVVIKGEYLKWCDKTLSCIRNPRTKQNLEDHLDNYFWIGSSKMRLRFLKKFFTNEVQRSRLRTEEILSNGAAFYEKRNLFNE